QAINAGDLMLMLPVSALNHLKTDSAIKWKLSLALGEAAQQIVRGQSFESELFAVCDRQQGYDEYFRCVRAKTAALFRLPAEGAALLSGLSSASAAALSESFEELGVLFQMQDDVLDLYGSKGREKPGQDLREGKVSCLVAEHMRRNPNDRQWLKEVLAKPREQTADSEVQLAIEKFASEGTLDAVIQRMIDLVSVVKASPGLKGNRALRDLALNLALTMLEPIEKVLSSRGVSVSAEL
ncbi:MAG: polyprenyl synthetase family protein, partial [Bdellovibrionia bacterium]